MSKAQQAPARKRFGQHFLRDAQVVRDIVSAVAPRPDDRVVEIGPGRGVLTHALLQHLPHLAAVEIDRDLALGLRVSLDRKLHLIEGDALHVDLIHLQQHWPWASAMGSAESEREAPSQTPPPLRLVGNLPYNLSTPLLLAFLRQSAVLRDQHVMLQTEVARRIAAPCDTVDYGRLGILMQAYYDVDLLFDVPPEAFAPPPKVRSTVLRLTPRVQPALPLAALHDLEEITRVAFSQRRKLMRHTLQPWLAQQAIEGFGVDFDCQRRAEQTPAHAFHQLASQRFAARARQHPATTDEALSKASEGQRRRLPA